MKRPVSTAALLVALVALVAGLGVAGCDDGREPTARPRPTQSAPSPSAPATSTPSTTSPAVASPGSRALEALQAAIDDLEAIRVRATTAGGQRVGRRGGVADVQTGDFRASLALPGGQRLEMIRQSDLTWTRAPAAYWVELGYTAQSAAEVRGRWVVAPADGMREIANAMDPGALVRTIQDLDPASVSSFGRVAGGPLRGNRVLTFHQGGSVQRVFLTPGAQPHLLRVTSTRSGTTTTVDVTELGGPLRLRLPDADDVVQPR